MREILFRAKRVDNGAWIEGDLLHPLNAETQGYYIVPIGCALHRMTQVAPATVGQYTGLTDKGGKRIFEGDIVTGRFAGEEITGYIVYGSDATFFVERKGLYGIWLNNAQDWTRIIGNIHDNPEELLEVSHV